MLSYKTHDPKGWCGDPKRGAALGRSTWNEPTEGSFAKPLVLRHVPLDSGGYDPNGTYFGHGERLYWVASADGAIDYVIRAPNRQAARAAVLEEHPKARFFR